MRRSLLSLILGLAAAVSAGAAAASAAPWTLTPCKVPGGEEIVRCGKLDVPENWSKPSGRRVSLNVVVMPKTGSGPDQPPLVWFDGGPGIPGTQGAALYSTDLRFHRERRPVVLFDQRGTGQSNPLHCPKTEHRGALDDMYDAASVAACRRDLERRADLSQYTTAASARDVDALRQALGARQIDIAALSYGTILAQAYIALFPHNVRAAALIGTVPLGEKLPLHHAANGQLALRQIFADCRAEPACRRAHPDLEGDWARLMTRLSDGPVQAADAAGRPVTIRKGPFGEALRSMINAIPGQRRLPLIVSHAARGDFAPFLKAAGGGEPEADGLYLSITCPEATRRIRPEEIGPATAGAAFGRWRIDQQRIGCGAWAPATPDPRVLSPLRSRVPVLLLAGGRDATTPVAWAREVATGLPNGRVVVIGPMAHLPDGLANMVCLDRLMDAFFAKGSAGDLDVRCVATMTPPPFELG